LNVITLVANEKGATLSQLALRWNNLQPAINVVLAGARNAEQTTPTAKATHLKILSQK